MFFGKKRKLELMREARAAAIDNEVVNKLKAETAKLEAEIKEIEVRTKYLYLEIDNFQSEINKRNYSQKAE